MANAAAAATATMVNSFQRRFFFMTRSVSSSAPGTGDRGARRVPRRPRPAGYIDVESWATGSCP